MGEWEMLFSPQFYFHVGVITFLLIPDYSCAETCLCKSSSLPAP